MWSSSATRTITIIIINFITSFLFHSLLLIVVDSLFTSLCSCIIFALENQQKHYMRNTRKAKPAKNLFDVPVTLAFHLYILPKQFLMPHCNHLLCESQFKRNFRSRIVSYVRAFLCVPSVRKRNFFIAATNVFFTANFRCRIKMRNGRFWHVPELD